MSKRSSIPASMAGSLSRRTPLRDCLLLADGTETLFDVYEASIQWDGQSRQIRVDEVQGAPLMGMALLEGSELRMKIQIGGTVEIQPLP
jgi:hypothetical protein